MKRFILFSTILLALFSCRNNIEEKKVNQNKDNPKIDTSIRLGENITSMHGYTKSIYEKNKIVYIDVDLVEIQYYNIDERKIINNNPKIRTYIVDNNSLIYSDDCKEITTIELLKIKDRLLNNHSIIIVAQSLNGKMISVNFGCYD